MNIIEIRNIGALGDLIRAGAVATATAAGAGDNTTVTGVTIDREGFAGGSLPMSALMGAAYAATLGSGKTLSVALTVQDSADNVTFADYATVASTVVATGPSGGGAVLGQFNTPVTLTSARRYVRLNFKPTHSATATDTSVTFPQAFIAGFDRLAAPTN